ncbi:OLC1v1030364C1 [Oldenlandia corymbosa var. corymbosa]|uniref:OLC1v1030364C1 n=1 Tax=Oldenlandia corymbosa var. corymbosa TaxID=529605 RepID=A0AAV1CFS8_OLDCO|nr:OLC1v1030364C1 [Oldenlandia corymbosa var. corymbosa]
MIAEEVLMSAPDKAAAAMVHGKSTTSSSSSTMMTEQVLLAIPGKAEPATEGGGSGSRIHDNGNREARSGQRFMEMCTQKRHVHLQRGKGVRQRTWG